MHFTIKLDLFEPHAFINQSVNSLDCLLNLLQSERVPELDVLRNLLFLELHFDFIEQVGDGKEINPASDRFNVLHLAEVAPLGVILESLLLKEYRLDHVLKTVVGDHFLLQFSGSLFVETYHARPNVSFELVSLLCVTLLNFSEVR